MLEGFTPWPDHLVEQYLKDGSWPNILLGDVLDQAVNKNPDGEAIVSVGRRITYREFRDYVNRLALYFLDAGISPQDRVLIQLPNVPEFLFAYFALGRIGAIAVPCHTSYRLNDILPILSITRAVAYIVPTTFRGFDYLPQAIAARESSPALRIILVAGTRQPESGDSLDQILEKPLEEHLESRLRYPYSQPTDVFLFLMSSGTTGAPKIIPRTHNDFLGASRVFGDLWGANRASRFLIATPIGHAAALGWGVQATVFAGGTLVLAESAEPEGLVDIIAKEQVDVTFLVPSIAVNLLNSQWIDSRQFDSLRLIVFGGQVLAREVAQNARQTMGCLIQNTYGMSEGFCTATRLDDDEKVILETVGRRVQEGDEYILIDERGMPVQPGKPGEMVCRGPSTIRGYYAPRELNQERFFNDGYLRTGDLLIHDRAGNLVVVGRKNDIINRGGEKISPEEIESLLLTHSAVAGAAVIGMPDAVLGERICAYIILRKRDRTTLSLTDVQEFLSRKRISKLKWPERLVIIEQFPLTPTGKVSKEKLRRDIASRYQ